MGSSTNTTTQSSSLPPDIQAGLSTALQRNLGASNLSYPMQGQPRAVAGFGDGQWQALNGMGQAAQYQPQQVGTGFQGYQVGDGFPVMWNQTGYNSQTVNPGDVTRYGSPSGLGGIGQYMNPYTSSVIGTSMDELNRQLAQSQQATAGQAAQAGAFGGDRAAVAQAENARNANQIAAQTIAGLNAQGFNTAAGLSQQDASRALQAGTAQSQLEANTGEANQYADLQAKNLNATQDRANQAAWLGTNTLNATQERANQAAQQAADQLNATQQRANQSAGLQGQQLNLSALGQMFNGQTLDQQTRQTMDDALYQNNYAANFWPVTAVQNLNQGIGTLAGLYPRTTTTTTPGPSTVGQIAGLGTAAAGLNSLTGGALTTGIKGLLGGNSASTTLAGDQLNSGFNVSGFDPGTGSSFADDLSGLGNIGSSASGAFDGGGLDLSSFGFARGGQVGYDDGGTVDDTYAPVGGDRVDALRRYLASARIAQAPANAQGDYSGYQPSAAPGNAQANLGLAAAAPQPQPSPLQQALAVNPADIVQNGPQGTAPAATNNGQRQDDSSPDNPVPDASPPVPPVPPVPPGQAPAPAPVQTLTTSMVPDRTTRSADPAAPMPPGYSGPSGGVAGQQQGSGDDWTHNKTGMALLAAGLGMMASRSPHALSAIGEGGLAGMHQLQTSINDDRQMQVLKNQLAYQQGMLGVRGAQVGVSQQKADQQGTYQQGRLEQGDQRLAQGDQRLAQQSELAQARIAKLYADAQNAGNKVTTAQLQQQAIDELTKPADQGGQGMSMADAYAQVRNFTARNEQADRRLDQGDRRQNELQDWRAFQQQSKATDQEISAARSVMNNASMLGKPLSMAQALQQVRGARESAGPAPVVGSPIGRGAASSAPPIVVQSQAQRDALPPGTRYTAPDGSIRIKGN